MASAFGAKIFALLCSSRGTLIILEEFTSRLVAVAPPERRRVRRVFGSTSRIVSVNIMFDQRFQPDHQNAHFLLQVLTIMGPKSLCELLFGMSHMLSPGRGSQVPGLRKTYSLH